MRGGTVWSACCNVLRLPLTWPSTTKCLRTCAIIAHCLSASSTSLRSCGVGLLFIYYCSISKSITLKLVAADEEWKAMNNVLSVCIKGSVMFKVSNWFAALRCSTTRSRRIHRWVGPLWFSIRAANVFEKGRDLPLVQTFHPLSLLLGSLQLENSIRKEETG